MATETLRPNGAGDSTAWPSLTGAATHWQATSDDSDSSYSRNNTGTPQENDYNLTNTALTSETITQIDVRVRARSETAATGQVTMGLRLSGTNSTASAHTSIPTSATNYTDTNIARPGGGSWSVSDLNSLQVVQIGDGGANGVRVFEVYVDVQYTAGGSTDTPIVMFM